MKGMLLSGACEDALASENGAWVARFSAVKPAVDSGQGSEKAGDKQGG